MAPSDQGWADRTKFQRIDRLLIDLVSRHSKQKQFYRDWNMAKNFHQKIFSLFENHSKKFYELFKVIFIIFAQKISKIFNFFFRNRREWRATWKCWFNGAQASFQFSDWPMRWRIFVADLKTTLEICWHWLPEIWSLFLAPIHRISERYKRTFLKLTVLYHLLHNRLVDHVSELRNDYVMISSKLNNDHVTILTMYRNNYVIIPQW